ncbi:spermidine/putrescine ABC transporter permease PotB [Vibrio stylophorae]|nr:spermidine/putrescine ABC transporter permease PotB [Vibrio stylophorae]
MNKAKSFEGGSRLQTWIIGLIVGWLVLFVFLPNLMIFITSFLTRHESHMVEASFTLSNYAKLVDPIFAKALWHSFYMAGMATFICLLVGYPFAYAITKLPQRMRPVALFLLIVPFWTNSLIRTYGLKAVLGANGLLNKSLLWMGLIDKPLRIMYTEYAVMIGLVYILLPFMILPLYSSLEKLDGSYLEAARDLGANAWQSFTRITLPLTMPGIIGGCLLVLLPALGMFYVGDMLGGAKNPLIGNTIKSQVLTMRDWPQGAATSVGLTLLMGLLLLIYWRASKMLNRRMELE